MTTRKRSAPSLLRFLKKPQVIEQIKSGAKKAAGLLFVTLVVAGWNFGGHLAYLFISERFVPRDEYDRTTTRMTELRERVVRLEVLVNPPLPHASPTPEKNQP